jgi:hypothetical protein
MTGLRTKIAIALQYSNQVLFVEYVPLFEGISVSTINHLRQSLRWQVLSVL